MLVVCPASVKDQWKSVINSIFPEDVAFVVKGAYKTEYAEKILEADFVIINYDILFSRTGAKSWTKKKNNPRKAAWNKLMSIFKKKNK